VSHTTGNPYFLDNGAGHCWHCDKPKEEHPVKLNKMEKCPALETKEAEESTKDDLACRELRCREIRNAASWYLDTLCEMTSDEFAHGADRDARLRLVRALGLPVEDYAL